MKSFVIGFTGKKQSGKSTACAYLTDKTKSKFGWKKIGFKDALVEELKKNFGLLLGEIQTLERQMNGDEYTVDELFFVKPPLIRKLLQGYGSEVRRGDDPQYWIKKWNRAVAYTPESVVVDDVRFLNEAEAVRNFGGVVIRIVRTDQKDEKDTHVSEAEMDLIKPDYTIKVKTGDHEGLYKQLEAILKKLSTAK